jgi:hypothetical protein
VGVGFAGARSRGALGGGGGGGGEAGSGGRGMVYILAETLGRQVSAADKWDCERQMAGFVGPHWIL